jgi:hypothetical protein
VIVRDTRFHEARSQIFEDAYKKERSKANAVASKHPLPLVPTPP